MAIENHLQLPGIMIAMMNHCNYKWIAIYKHENGLFIISLEMYITIIKHCINRRFSYG